MGLVNVDLDNVSLDGENFVDDDDPGGVIHAGLTTWCNRFKQHKELKKEISKELIPIAWYPTRWLDWCMSEDEKRNRSVFNR